MALFHQPVSKIQIAQVLGMSESKLRRDMKRLVPEFPPHRRLSLKEAENLIEQLGYDSTDEVLIQRAKGVQDDVPIRS